jgi:hypothetical protein
MVVLKMPSSDLGKVDLLMFGFLEAEHQQHPRGDGPDDRPDLPAVRAASTSQPAPLTMRAPL